MSHCITDIHCERKKQHKDQWVYVLIKRKQTQKCVNHYAASPLVHGWVQDSLGSELMLAIIQPRRAKVPFDRKDVLQHTGWRWALQENLLFILSFKELIIMYLIFFVTALFSVNSVKRKTWFLKNVSYKINFYWEKKSIPASTYCTFVLFIIGGCGWTAENNIEIKEWVACHNSQDLT